MTARYKSLIIDDDSLNLEIMNKTLTERGYDVVEATDALEALEILRKDSKFHIILLDRMMPKMNGLDFLKILKQDKDLKNIPVIIQSALTEIPQIAEGYDENCYFYLTKPFKPEMMLNVVKRAIDKSYSMKIMAIKTAPQDTIEKAILQNMPL